MLLKLLFFQSTGIALSLQLRRSWQAIPGGKSVLAITSVAVPPLSPSLTGTTVNLAETAEHPTHFLATAGHDGGAVRFWSMADGGLEGNATAAAVSTIHNGSIFTLASQAGHLLSGSFDRSATIQHVRKQAKNEGDNKSLAFATVATLPDHTGWVRKVHIIPPPPGNGKGGGICLSIGCNFINVWAATPQTTSVRRLARLDAGPSPGDPEDEMPFRRHDILTMDVVSPGEHPSSSIVAGLVDGTLRAFTGDWNVWNNWPEDARDEVHDGQRSRGHVSASDGRPYAAVQAHRCRVTGVHSVGNVVETAHDEFISVGQDGCWRYWHLDSTKKSSFAMINEGSIVGLDCAESDASNYRICASVLVTENKREISLVAGTTSGGIYHIPLSREVRAAPAKARKIWQEETGCSITALACTPCAKSRIVAGNSCGIVRVFG